MRSPRGVLRALWALGASRAVLRAATIAVGLLALTACATMRPAVRDARRAEEAVERAPIPAVPRPAPVAVTPAARPALIPPSPLAPSAAPQPFAQLSGRAAGAPTAVAHAVDDLLFVAGSAQLDAAARAKLDAFVVTLGALGGAYRLEVQGHTDASGGEGDNLEISLRRAEAVRDYLRRAIARRLAAPPRMAVLALGSRYPAADNQTAAGRARNRRVTVLVLR